MMGVGIFICFKINKSGGRDLRGCRGEWQSRALLIMQKWSSKIMGKKR